MCKYLNELNIQSRFGICICMCNLLRVYQDLTLFYSQRGGRSTFSMSDILTLQNCWDQIFYHFNDKHSATFILSVNQRMKTCRHFLTSVSRSVWCQLFLIIIGWIISIIIVCLKLHFILLSALLTRVHKQCKLYFPFIVTFRRKSLCRSITLYLFLQRQ